MDDPNPTVSPRSSYLNRDLTTWSYTQLCDLFEDNEDFVLYLSEADHTAAFFWHDGECWLMCEAPTTEMNQAAPEVVEDWLGATAEKEPGAEPVLMHRDEVPGNVTRMIEYVQEREPTHVHDEWAEMDLGE